MSGRRTILQKEEGERHITSFLLVLSESGIFAAVSFLFLVLMTLVVAFKICYSADDDRMCVAMLLAFLTFVIHSLFNNFLDTDKTALLFYASIAFFASVKLFPSKNNRYEG